MAAFSVMSKDATIVVVLSEVNIFLLKAQQRMGIIAFLCKNMIFSLQP